MARDFRVVVAPEADLCGGWIYAHRGEAAVLVLAPTLTKAGRAAAFTQAFAWHEHETKRAA